METMEKVVVEAQRSSNALVRAAQREAPNLVNLMTADDIKKLPDVSVGEALGRLPGVSLEYDTGEGRYINIRGIDSDLNSTTFGGLRLPPSNNASPQGGGRAVAMDAIPNGLVGAITLTKTNLPEQDAEAIGGTVEITPKTAPRNGRSFLEGHVGSGYEPLRGSYITDLSITGGGRFGGSTGQSSGASSFSDRPFSIVATAAYYEDKRGIDDVEPAFIDGSPYAAPSLASAGWDQRWYQYHRQRHGIGLDLGYRPDATSSYYLRGFDAGYTESVHRQRLTITPDGTPAVSGNGFVDGLSVNGFDKTLRDEKEKIGNQVFVAGGKNQWDDEVLDYRLGYTRGSYDKLYDYNSDFNYTPPAGTTSTINGVPVTAPTINYSFNGQGSTPLFTVTGANFLNPSNYSLASFQNSTETIRDQETSGALNYKLRVRWADADDESLKLGLSVRDRKRTLDNPHFSLPSNLLGLPLTSAIAGPGISFYDGQYQNLPQINIGQLQGTYGGQMVASSKDFSNTMLAFADDRENVSAAYGQYQWQQGSVDIVTGLRVEHTRGDYTGIAKITDANGNVSFQRNTATRSYSNLFPSLQSRFALDTDTQLRAVYSTAIGRPGFPQITPTLQIDVGANTVTSGNANLKPITSNAFDLSLEHYLPDAGILSVGVFDKELSNYIVANQTTQTFPNQGLFLGLVGAVHVQTFSNASHSFARGIEFNYEQRFKGLPDFWSGLGASFNYTFVNSRFEIRPGETSQLPSTSRNTANAALFYERNGVNLRLAAYYVSPDLWAVGANSGTDVWNRRGMTVDFGGSYAFSQHASFYLNVKNLSNTPLKFYEGRNTSNRTIQREFYESTYQAGLNFNY
ncbi:MAG: TonB-dependent receptor [Paucibacter sp.]|nr:TonB-dependent receptor [Roseateles sp.]